MCMHFIIPFGKLGSPYLGKTTAVARTVLPSPTSACWVFTFSEIHRTLTWTTGSLTCVRDHSYACVYTRGLGTPTASQHNSFVSGEQLSHFYCAPDAGWIRISGRWLSSPTLYPLSHTVPPRVYEMQARK